MSIVRPEMKYLPVLQELYKDGYAVVLFTPEELGECNPSACIGHMIKYGWDFIGANNPDTDEDEVRE